MSDREYFKRIEDAESAKELASLREQLASVTAERDELRVKLQVAEWDCETKRNALEAVNAGGGVPDDDCWEELKRQRDAANQRAEAAERVAEQRCRENDLLQSQTYSLQSRLADAERRERELREALTFSAFRQANERRCKQWDQGTPPPLSFRGVELAGEAGEVCNAVKKLERLRMGMKGGKDTTENLREELADVVICVDLLAKDLGIDLGAAVVSKFNATSEKYGLDDRLPTPTPAAASEPGAMDGNRLLPFDQDVLGRKVREAIPRLAAELTVAKSDLRRVEDMLCECSQILDGWSSDSCYSKYDAEVRQRICDYNIEKLRRVRPPATTPAAASEGKPLPKRRCECGRMIVAGMDPLPTGTAVCRDCGHQLCEWCCTARKSRQPSHTPSTTTTPEAGCRRHRDLSFSEATQGFDFREDSPCTCDKPTPATTTGTGEGRTGFCDGCGAELPMSELLPINTRTLAGFCICKKCDATPSQPTTEKGGEA